MSGREGAGLEGRAVAWVGGGTVGALVMRVGAGRVGGGVGPLVVRPYQVWTPLWSLQADFWVWDVV
jgi:hypothetical protein